MHPGTLEPGTYGGLATGLNDTRTHSKSLGTEVGVLHPLTIALDIVGALTYVLTLGSGPQDAQKVIQTSLGQGLATRFGPRLNTGRVSRMERLGGVPDLLLGVIEIDDLNRLGELFAGQVPDPGGSVAQHDPTPGPSKAPALGLAAHPPGKRRQPGVGIAGGRTLDRRRVAD